MKAAKILAYNLLLLYLATYLIGLVIYAIKRDRFTEPNGLGFSHCADATQVINPVFGFLRNNCHKSDLAVNIGFTEEYNKDIGNRSEYFNVLVIGGSVASHLSRDRVLEKALVSELQHYVGDSKTLRIFNAALEGAKQPQGLHAYTTLRSLGYRFSIIIELSGFNEITLAIADNFRIGLPLYYPRHASSFLRQISYIERDGLLEKLLSWPFEAHPLHKVYKSLWISGLLENVLFERYDWHEFNSKYGFSHRQASIRTEDEAFMQSRQIYSSSVEMLARVAQIDGTPYFLFLQPNQHILGSKVPTELEHDIAYPEAHWLFDLTSTTQQDLEYARVARLYYSRLEANAFSPTTRVVDMRFLFQGNIDDTVYADACCHFNGLGMELQARFMARKVREYLASQ